MNPPHNFYLSNSKLRSWESMCKLEWQHLYILKDERYQFVESDAMHHGNVFETMVVGKGINGAIQPNEKLLKSTYYQRLKDNAALCRQFLRDFGGRVKQVQLYIATTVLDDAGRTIYIEGTLDIVYRFNDGRWAIIDLKFTGDHESDFGKWQFGDEEKIDPSQALQYMVLFEAINKVVPEWYYFVFALKKNSTPKIIQVETDIHTLPNHIERLSKAYHEIIECLDTGLFPAQPKYSRCSKCKVKCSEERKIPDIIKIIK